MKPASPDALDYATYLEIDTLLDLQHERSDPAEHDEMLFIVIHQVYELWFKLMMHELRQVCTDLSVNRMYGALAGFKRCRMIMKTLVNQLDILETMTPMSFRSFRDRLDTSSGFQSVQFREFEFMLGYRRKSVLQLLPDRPDKAARSARMLSAPSVIDHFYEFLAANGVEIPDELTNRNREQSNQPNDTVQAGILELYKTRPDLVILFELMTDFDEGLQEWRYRHVKLVERTIGNKKGTGGSLGVEFLKKSLFMPAFADLWAIRHEL